MWGWVRWGSREVGWEVISIIQAKDDVPLDQLRAGEVLRGQTRTHFEDRGPGGGARIEAWVSPRSGGLSNQRDDMKWRLRQVGEGESWEYRPGHVTYELPSSSHVGAAGGCCIYEF